MGSTPPDPELFEDSRELITESRRARAKLDDLWQAHLGGRERVNDHCLSFLSEARARLDARGSDRAELAHHAID